MCLDLLDPCKICKFIQAMFCIGLLVVIGGYIGKGLYLYVNSGIDFKEVITDPAFWVPDGYFWVMGLSFVALLFVVFGLLRCILMGISKACGFVLCCKCLNWRSDKRERSIDEISLNLLETSAGNKARILV